MDKIIRQNTKIIYLLKGLFISYIVTGFILLILAFLMLKMDISSAVISGGTIFTYILSGFISGFYVGKKVEQKKFLWGLAMGVAYFIIFMLVSILMNQGASLALGSLLMVLIISAISGMVGGMLS
ncbi:MAG: TIGR04086 family membrane protein [Clostridiales bacterium]|jgi:putative membrane protein (TIGR04086 family)|nr:TIGR04086 family membrane protein [Clostridiales bacterium]